MKVNGIDLRKYDAKQLTVEILPPSIATNYEWITGAALPNEFDTDIQSGHIKISILFRGSSRNSIVRSMSEFMSNFTKSCELELDGYKGKYKGYITSDDYEKTIAKNRYILNIEFDGYFYDDDLEIVFDGVTEASFFKVGTRNAPCIVEVYADNELSNYTISGFGNSDIVIESLTVGKTIIIDGIQGIITVDGANAFDKVDLWEFPELTSGETKLVFSNTGAKITVKYTPMWI